VIPAIRRNSVRSTEEKKNRAIEIHDAMLARLSLEGGDARLHFSEVYIHESQGIPGRDAGSGWVQEARVTISGAGSKFRSLSGPPISRSVTLLLTVRS
jgi:hypothetical protein